ncbi:hypothetical protein ACHOLT_11770 [Desulfitobacterium sp. Sab5]|uniref:hypothetical protein n=1 Tax=Desulfitobacterium nosdiversum TaxID=3375356 RepID=UPI003CF378E8
MPTIEIVSLGRENLIKLNRKKYPFQIQQERKLVSHRNLFNNYLANKKGVIFHLGNLGLSRKGFWFASDLVDWDFESESIIVSGEDEEVSEGSPYFRFRLEYLNGVKDLMFKAFNQSPLQTVLFLTDYQFGSCPASNVSLDEIKKLWKIHDSEGLKWNTLYNISSISCSR